MLMRNFQSVVFVLGVAQCWSYIIEKADGEFKRMPSRQQFKNNEKSQAHIDEWTNLKAGLNKRVLAVCNLGTSPIQTALNNVTDQNLNISVS